MSSAPEASFPEAIARFGKNVPLVLCHDDADGLSAGAIFARAFARSSRGLARVRVIGRGESAWSAAIRTELAGGPSVSGLIVTDLGVQKDAILTGVPTVIVDHHVPRSFPSVDTTTLITGYGDEPTPTSSLLAHRCAVALLGEDAASDLAWLAAIGLIGDLGERAALAQFPTELGDVKRTHSSKTLREAVSLVNAPRRASHGDASPALRLLMKAGGPEDVISDTHPESALLRAARMEVQAALDVARKVPPIFAGSVALIRCDSPCQVHALVAQSWLHRLRRQVVIAANAGFREGYVHFAVRSAAVPDLISFLEERAPPLEPEDQFAQGHRRATGGQVRQTTWNRFLAGLGFDSAAQVLT